jgi:hypothetical protein
MSKVAHSSLMAVPEIDPVLGACCGPWQSARQGFALALTTLMCTLPVIHGDAVMQLIESILEVTSAMKGQVGLIYRHFL